MAGRGLSGPNGLQVIRVTIVEDNDAETALLEGHLERYAKDHGIACEVSRVASALDFGASQRVADLIFLDIGLPGMSGMEVARLIRSYDEETPIIFTTSLAQYAVSAWEVDALDFIVKPVRYRDLALRLDRAMRVLRRTKDRVLYVTAKDAVHVMPVADIVAVEVRNHTLTYHLEGRDPVEVRGTLAEALDRLSGAAFVRISNSCLVNMDHIRTIRGMKVTTSVGETFFLSHPRRAEAMARVADYFGGNE